MLSEFSHVFVDNFINATNTTDWSEPQNQVVKPHELFDIYQKSVFVPVAILIMLGLLVYYLVFLRPGKPYADEMITQLDEQEKQTLGGMSPKIGSSTDMGILYGFIQQAYEGLEHNNLEEAYNAYSLAMSYLSRIKLNIKNKFRVNYEMNTLREKIINNKGAS